MMKSDFTSFSELTRPSKDIKEIANQFGGSDREIIEQIIEWIESNLERKKPKKETFRKRSVKEIIKSGYAENCSDEALVFITLTRLNDIPTKYVYLLEGRRIKENYSHRSGGHTIARCHIDGEWIYVDPSPNAFYGNFLGKEIDIPFDRWIHYHEGKNWEELDLNDWKKMMDAAKERPPMCEIEIPEEIFDWCIEKGKEKDINSSKLLRKILKRGFEDFKTQK